MLETLRSYWSIISTIITVVAVPAVGYLYKKYKQADARQKAVELGVQALLRDRIVQSYYHYEERGWITLHGLENVNAMYKEYHALGGNGTVTALVNTIHELEVRDDKRPASVEKWVVSLPLGRPEMNMEMSVRRTLRPSSARTLTAVASVMTSSRPSPAMWL